MVVDYLHLNYLSLIIVMCVGSLDLVAQLSVTVLRYSYCIWSMSIVAWTLSHV